METGSAKVSWAVDDNPEDDSNDNLAVEIKLYNTVPKLHLLTCTWPGGLQGGTDITVQIWTDIRC